MKIRDRAFAWSVLAALLAPAGSATAAPAAGLLRAADAREGLVAQDGAEVVRSRYVSLDIAALPKAGEQATFNVFDGLNIPVTMDRTESAYDGGTVYVGHITDRAMSEVIISVYKDAAVINLRDPMDGTFFEIKPAGLGLFAASQVNEDILPGCGFICDNAQLRLLQLGSKVLEDNFTDVDTVIDIIILFTPAAQSQTGGLNGMIATLNGYVTTTNNAYTNSQILQQIRLVNASFTNYTEAASMGTDLNRLSANGDGFMDEAHTLRNTFGGDLVHLVSGAANGACGISGLGGNNANIAFGVTARSCGPYTFAHELGHAMGCCHAPGDGGGCGTGGFFCYAAGWRSLDQRWHDIMAYDPGNRIAYFSNPNIVVNLTNSQNQTVPYTIGVADPPGCSMPSQPGVYAADNARCMNNTRTTIANYRPTQVGNPPPGPFALTTPANNAVGRPTGPSFAWDPAEFASDYSILISSTPDLSDVVFQDNSNFAGATVPFGTLTYTNRYYWTVTASNLGGQTQTSSGIFTFRVGPYGDISGNGVVDFADLNSVLGQFGQTGPGLPADINRDGIVNFADLNVILSNFGQSAL